MKSKSERHTKIEQAILDRASQNLQKACRELGVNIVAPFTLRAGNCAVACVAFLPDFGGAEGMVIGAMDLPHIVADEQLKRLVKEKYLYLSFVNVSAFANHSVDEKVFKEMLKDWGYYGPRIGRPDWFADDTHLRD